MLKYSPFIALQCTTMFTYWPFVYVGLQKKIHFKIIQLLLTLPLHYRSNYIASQKNGRFEKSVYDILFMGYMHVLLSTSVCIIRATIVVLAYYETLYAIFVAKGFNSIKKFDNWPWYFYWCMNNTENWNNYSNRAYTFDQTPIMKFLEFIILQWVLISETKKVTVAK